MKSYREPLTRQDALPFARATRRAADALSELIELASHHPGFWKGRAAFCTRLCRVANELPGQLEGIVFTRITRDTTNLFSGCNWPLERDPFVVEHEKAERPDHE